MFFFVIGAIQICYDDDDGDDDDDGGDGDDNDW